MESTDIRQREHKRNWRIPLAFVLLALIVCGVIVFRGLGRWLVREDSPAHADAIVVLSGGLPSRAEGAAKYFALGYASEVWITKPEGPADAVQGIGDFIFTAKKNIAARF